MTDSSGNRDRGGERRTNLELRALIDEMLSRVREMHRNTQVWDPAERARAEAELEAIMARVRREAGRTPEEAQPAAESGTE
jgi:hypothetical protein